MASCAACRNLILFGGVRDGDRRYCNAKCHASGTVKRAQDDIPDDLVESEAARLHASPCPLCEGPGPVDVNYAHTCVSFLVATQWKSTPVVACYACAKKKQHGAIAKTLLLGWWGFPWGLIRTPVQIAKNLSAGPSPVRPSDDLKRLVLSMLAAQAVEQAGPPDPLQRGFYVLPPQA